MTQRDYNREGGKIIQVNEAQGDKKKRDIL